MPNTKRKKILVLDSDADRLVVVEQMLEDAGYETTTTWDVRIAKELLAGDGYSLVLIGDHPPDIGSDILDTVWSKSPDIHCIVLRPARSWSLSDVLDHVNHCLQSSAELERPVSAA